MRYTANLLGVEQDPATWARQREAEGWHALSVADHVFTPRHPYPHVWVSATAMATATSDVTISTASVNDLMRSPKVPDAHLLDVVARVRAVRPDVEISMFTLFAVGDDPVTRHVADAMSDGGGLFHRFFGSAERVADGLAWLESLGVSSASLSPMTAQSLSELAPHVL